MSPLPPPPPPPPPAITVRAAPVTFPGLVQMTTMSGLTLSPDGRWLAYRTERGSLATNRVELRWYVVPVDGSTPTRAIGDGGEATFDLSGGTELQTPVWAPASGALYYRALIKREMQVWRAPIEGGAAAPMTADPANIRSLALDPDGASLSYTVDATRAALVKAEQDAFDQGTPGDGSADLGQPASRGSFIDGEFASRRSKRDWYEWGNLLWQTPTRTSHVAIPMADRSPGRLAAAPEAVTWATRWEPERVHGRLVITPPGGVPITCTTTLCDERGPVAVAKVPGRDGYLLTLRDPALRDTLVFWDPVTQASRTLLVSDGLVTGGDPQAPQCAASAQALYCVTEAAAAPPALVRIDVDTGRTTTLSAPNAALANRVTATPRLLTWRGRRGEEHTAQLILPPRPMPAGGFPVVFTYYICDGFLRGGTGGELPLYPLAQTGIATLCITRGRSDYRHQDARADQRRAVEDIEHALAMLEREHLIDRRRIGGWGYSFGSEVLTRVLLRTDILAAAAAASDLIDPSVYWFQSLPGRSYPNTVMQKVWKLGSPDVDRRGWKSVAPALDIAKVRVPLLLQAPESEVRSMIQFWSKLATTRTPAELWMFANEPHTKIFPRHQAVIMARNLDWFRYWLDGERDPDPSKAAQYARWDGLARRW